MTRPYMTPRECAERLEEAGLGVSAAYIRGDIRDGLLTAEIVHREIRPGRSRSKPLIHVYEADFREYVRTTWPRLFDLVFPPAA